MKILHLNLKSGNKLTPLFVAKVLLITLIILHAAKGIWWMGWFWEAILGIIFLSTAQSRVIRRFREKTWLVVPLTLMGAVLLAIFLRTLIFGLYSVPSASMERTLIPGDVVWVNKTLAGPRLPSSPYEVPWIGLIFWLLQDEESDIHEPWWDYRRLKGYSSIKTGDIVVFNHPGSGEVFIKRCMGTPGDTLQIMDGHVKTNDRRVATPNAIFNTRVEYKNREKAWKEIREITESPHHFYQQHRNGQINLATTREEMQAISKAKSVKTALIEPERPDSTWTLYPDSKEIAWDLDHFGPYIIPAKGTTIKLDRHHYQIYKPLIEDLENKTCSHEEDKFYINEIPTTHYTFERDFFFMMGDHRHDSYDSRLFGPVPESDIIGKATTVLFSTNPQHAWHERLLKKLE